MVNETVKTIGTIVGVIIVIKVYGTIKYTKGYYDGRKAEQKEAG